MAQVDLKISGKSYGIACDDGQESRVLELGQIINDMVDQINQAGLGARNDAHALVLAALMMADEKEELKARLDSISKGGSLDAIQVQEKVVYKGLSNDEEALIVGAVKHLASRIDGLSQRMETN